MQAAEMIAGVSGAGGRLVETQESLVLARQHGLHVGKELVAQLGTVDVRAEPGQLVAAPAPTCDEILACHGETRMLPAKHRPRSLSSQRRPPLVSVLRDPSGRSQPACCQTCVPPSELEAGGARDLG